MEHPRRRILVFADWFLPGYRAGGPIRSLANLVNALDDDFLIITRSTDHHSTEQYPGIRPGEWIAFSPNVKVMYVQDEMMTRSFVKEILRNTTFDCIYLNSLFSPRFTLIPLWVWKSSVRKGKVILAPRGMLKSGALSIKSKKKNWFIRFSKWTNLFKGVIWHATNSQEAQEIQDNFGGKCEVRIAPNLPAGQGAGQHIRAKTPGDLRLISIARISPEKGILEAIKFITESAVKGSWQVTFYGAHQNPEYLRNCQEMANLVPNAQIDFPGEINPTDITAAFDRHHFFLSATWGENFGHAIAEALLHGLPVIISDKTPWRNLQESAAGWDLPLEPKAFDSVFEKCMQMDQHEYEHICHSTAAFGAAVLADPTNLEACKKLFS